MAKHTGSDIGVALRWLATSREHTNFTYDLTPTNLEHLAWWVTAISGCPVEAARGYIAEALNDEDIQRHVAHGVERSDRRGLADRQTRISRRAGWYAVVRHLRPSCVVETGTDKGLGSVVLASALLVNGFGRLITFDINPSSGYLVTGAYATVTELVIGDSVSGLRGLQAEVDLFIHDSDHSAEHEAAEYTAVQAALTAGAIVLSDNSHVTRALPVWAERTGRSFLYFGERPKDHWYPGAGIGAAFRAV